MKTAKYYKSRPLRIFVGVFVYLAVFNISALQGQNLKTYEENQLLKIDTILQNVKEDNKNLPLTLLPSVNYNLQTGTSIGFSLSSFISYKQNRKRNKIEFQKLKTELMEHLAKKVNDAEIEEMEIISTSKSIEYELKILKEKYELYKINFLSYKNKEIPFSNYTSSKINYMESFKSTFSKIDRLELKIKRFNTKYNYKPFEIDTLLKTAKTYQL